MAALAVRHNMEVSHDTSFVLVSSHTILYPMWILKYFENTKNHKRRRTTTTWPQYKALVPLRSGVEPTTFWHWAADNGRQQGSHVPHAGGGDWAWYGLDQQWRALHLIHQREARWVQAAVQREWPLEVVIISGEYKVAVITIGPIVIIIIIIKIQSFVAPYPKWNPALRSFTI